MQGQRGIIGSSPETLEFDHQSSGNAIMDPQLRWNNMRSSAENRLAEFVLPSSHINNSFVNPIDQERQDLSSWRLGEPSSSGGQNEVTRDGWQKVEHGWLTTASTCGGSGPRLEDRRYESRNSLSLDNVNVNPQPMQSSSQGVIPQNLNLNAGFVGHGNDDCQVIERPSTFKPGGAVTEQVPSTGGSDSLLLPSGSGGYLVEETAVRPGSSLDGRRQSCKRKAVEGHIGQSSASGSSSFFQRSDGSAWTGAPGHLDAGSSLNMPSTENQNARLGLGIRGLASDSATDSVTTGHGESSNRNFRLRINPSNRDRESIPANLFSTGGTVRRSNIPSSHHSSRLLPVDHSPDVRSSPAVEGTNPPGQPVIIPVPALPQNAPPFRWNEGSSSRANISSSSINLGGREESSSRTAARSLWQHPMVVAGADLRALVRNPTNRSGSNASISIPGNAATSSRSSSSSGVHPIPAPSALAAASPHSRYSRRMADYVRRSLSSVHGADSGGQGSVPVHPSISAASEDMVLPSGANHQAHQRPYPRLSWMERHADGLAYPLRALSASGEGSRRLVVPEEIRNVLDLMRRESLRFEDVMVLDQSVFFGVPDFHDRHRDMRLDVDNMSYEELLALGERIGSVSTGLSEETIENRLRRRSYVGQERGEADAEPCCVCQEDYNDGEDVGTLDCGHDFHSDCIKQWLKHKNLCPICKTNGLAT